MAQAFAAAGIKLVADPNFCSPASLKDSPLLIIVPDATVQVTAEEAAWWEQTEDLPQRMRHVVSAFLSGARTKDPSIQTFDDVNRHLTRHPGDDDAFCEMLEGSGYLSVWEIEWQQNRWQYDLELMRAAPADQIEDYCWSVVANEDDGPSRYVVNRGGYLLFARQYGLRFFGLMAGLYEHLTTLHRQRVETASRWLEENGRLHNAPPAALTPHTSEWFAVLEQWDPPKAMMTREIIKSVGRSDVCSVCGDDTASDYRLAEGRRPPSGVDTLRLCDDCVNIRREGGEPFELLSEGDDVGDQGQHNGD